MDKKENTFAKEVAAQKVSPAEEMNRNQAVHLLYLQSRKVMLKADRVHLHSQIDLFASVLQDVATMPQCECKEATMLNINNQMAAYEKALESSKFDGLSAMTLDALERLHKFTTCKLVTDPGVN